MFKRGIEHVAEHDQQIPEAAQRQRDDERRGPECFAQVHRAIVVNLAAVAQVVRHDNDTAELHLKGRDEVLPVARSRIGIFRQM